VIPVDRMADPLLGSLDPDELELVLRPPGRMLPAAAYTDPGVLAWERREFLDGGWQCLGRTSGFGEGLTAPRSRVAVPLGAAHGSASLLLVRGDDGVLRGFHNSCRHRGHELLPCSSDAPGAGRARFLACPYHAWVYDLEGRLVRVPALDDGEAVALGAAVPAARAAHPDRDRLGLLPVPVAEWQGFVLVNLDGRAGPLAEHVAGLDGLLSAYGLADLVVAAGHDYQLAANWKLAVENYHECYHCPSIHPELCRVSSPDSGDNFGGPGRWIGGGMELEPGVRTMSLDGQGSGPYLPGLPEDRRNQVVYLQLFPNLLISLHPDYVMTHLLDPVTPDRTRVVCQWLFPPQASADDRFDPGYAVDFWDLTNRQDWAACESVQRALASPGFSPGPLSAWHEQVVGSSIAAIARAYLDSNGRAA
jgi:Rieske 2Fe-2S family protein